MPFFTSLWGFGGSYKLGKWCSEVPYFEVNCDSGGGDDLKNKFDLLTFQRVYREQNQLVLLQDRYTLKNAM